MIAGDPRDGLHLRLNLETALNYKSVGPQLGAGLSYAATVSYTHLTLPTNREV